MRAEHPPNAEQTTLWNGPAGEAWVESQALLDDLFKPFEDYLADSIAKRSARQVLDIGCGTGSTTLAAARRLPPNGRCVGLDLSEPMISTARTRAERAGSSAHFICGDAQTYGFEPAAFDQLISRFGVMFFDDPVRAFANLRGAAAPGAELRAITWRSAAENPFMTTAERAAAPYLSNLPARRPDGPGQFAFADPERVRSILEPSGWVQIDIQALDVPCGLPESALMQYLSRHGPVGLAIRELDAGARSTIIEKVRSAFDAYVHGSNVQFKAACWVVCARARV